MYKLEFDKKALHELKKLDKVTGDRIWNKLQDCKTDPFRFLESLEEFNLFKLRVGDYRILIDVNFEDKILKIIKAGHRKNIYERWTK